MSNRTAVEAESPKGTTYGDELERIPVEPKQDLAAAAKLRDETRAILTNAHVFVERPGNIDLGMADGFTREEREEIDQ